MEDTAPFGGKPGEPVPEVDPKDIKAVWKVYRDVAKKHPGERAEQVAVGSEFLERVCKPGANIWAVWYRNAMLHTLTAWEELSPWIKNGELDDALFRAAATIPMKWAEVGQRLDFPDEQDFLRRVRE